jgi:hypothetical protein
MPACFFDTCALIPRYRQGSYTHRVNRIFKGKRPILVCEITVLEIASTFAKICRDKHLRDEEYTRMQCEFFRDISSGRVTVRKLESPDLLRAIHLINFAGVLRRCGLKSADAAVAASCRQAALERRERLTFYTMDWKLFRALYECNAYRSAISLRYLGRGKDGIAL